MQGRQTAVLFISAAGFRYNVYTPKWKDPVKKLITLSLLLLTLVSCSNTAPSSSMPAPTLPALPSAIPTEAPQTFSSKVPTTEAPATAMPDSGDILNPQGSPLDEWRGIPIMPEAIAGQEFTPDNAYSFTVDTTEENEQNF